MIYREHKPSAQLADYIFRYWTVSTAQCSRPEKCIPDGYIKLFIYLSRNTLIYTSESGEQKHWRGGVGGHPRAGGLSVYSPANTRLIACTLKPAFFYGLCKVPVSELNNSITDLYDLFGTEGDDLNEKILAASTEAEQVSILDAFFLDRLKHLSPSLPASQLEYAQNLLLQSNGSADISQICGLVNLSERGLERHFLTHVGVSPKYYARILRFNHAYRLKKEDGGINWGDVVFRCGYYDQSHFIKEFKHFTHTLPTLFYSEKHQIKDIYLGK